MNKNKPYKKRNVQKPIPSKIKVHVVNGYLAKCPNCGTVLSVYPFKLRISSNNTKNQNGRLCSKCEKLFLDIHVFYKYSRFFSATNYAEIKPDLDKIEKMKQERHEMKMQKTNEKNLQKEQFISGLQSEIEKLDIKNAPVWKSVLNKSSLATLSKITFVFLLKRDSGKSEWYFITDEGRKDNHASTGVHIQGPECFMGRALIEAMASGSNMVKLFGDSHEILFKYITNLSLADEIINKTVKATHSVGNKRNSSKRVYVYFKLNNKCVTNNHQIETVTAITTNMKTGFTTEINVFHCIECDRYFINYEALQKYIAKGIYPALDFSLEIDEGKLREVSELMLYGYNVKEGVLNEGERHRILSWIIDAGLLSKAEIIKDLQFKVNYNGKKAGNENAKKKWETDILFVSQYVKGNSKRIDAVFEKR